VPYQKERIFREKRLSKHNIKGLINIIDVGTIVNEGEYFYIIMPFLSGCNLKEYIEINGACEEIFARYILSTLIKISDELQKLGIAHRDIKPENIMVMENNEIILMDLGVLKIINVDDLTDIGDSKPFIGTLRYAPPELLLRNEENNTNGWKAINIYQIGATMHDVLMGYELFKQYSDPYARLVRAVCESIPHIDREDCNQELVHLIQNMLTKNWQLRLNLFNKTDITKILCTQNIKNKNDVLSKILYMQSDNMTQEEQIKMFKEKREEQKSKINNFYNEIRIILESCFIELTKKNIIEAWNIHHYRAYNVPNRFVASYVINGNLTQGFYGTVEIFIIFPLQIDDCNIQAIAEIDFNKHNISKRVRRGGDDLFGTEYILPNEKRYILPSERYITVFAGAFNKLYIQQKLMDVINKILYESLKRMKPLVDAEYKYAKQQINNTNSVSSRFYTLPKNFIIDNIIVVNENGE